MTHTTPHEKSTPRHLAAILAFVAIAFGATSALAGVHVARSDGLCPAGQLPISPAEARSDARDICGALGTWDIARLAGGGSMDGPGYGCKIRDHDARALGHTICAPVRELRPLPRPRPVPRPDVYRPHPKPRPGAYRPSAPRLRAGQPIALRSAHGDFLAATPDGRLYGDRGRWGRAQVFTLDADGPVRHGAAVQLVSTYGQYVTATRDGRAVARDGRRAKRSRWTIESAEGQRALTCGDRVRLRGPYGLYLVAGADGRASADRGLPASWETFTVVCR